MQREEFHHRSVAASTRRFFTQTSLKRKWTTSARKPSIIMGGSLQLTIWFFQMSTKFVMMTNTSSSRTLWRPAWCSLSETVRFTTCWMQSLTYRLSQQVQMKNQSDYIQLAVYYQFSTSVPTSHLFVIFQTKKKKYTLCLGPSTASIYAIYKLCRRILRE